MTVKKLKAKLDQAFDNHAAALKTGDTDHIQKVWNVYALAKNAYMEAYFGGAD